MPDDYDYDDDEAEIPVEPYYESAEYDDDSEPIYDDSDMGGCPDGDHCDCYHNDGLMCCDCGAVSD